MRRKFNPDHYYPHYNKDVDYSTNANNFYHYLGKNKELIRKLVDEILNLYEDTELTIQQFQDRLDGIKEEMKDFFILWLEDGTLEQIINENIFEDLNNRLSEVNTELDNARINVLNQTFPTLKERLDVFESKTTLNIERLNNETEQLETSKKNRMENYIYLADFEKLPNESDDEHINRALLSLTGHGFAEWGGTSTDGTLVLEGKNYDLTRPIRLHPYQTLKGAGHATVLNMTDSGSTIIDLPKPADNSYYVYGTTIEDLILIGNGLNVGIELRDSSHVTIRNTFIYETAIGVQGTDVWLAHFDRVTVRNYNKRGEYGFKIDGGTSNTYTATWAQYVKKGYQMWTWYSTMNSPACDDFTEYAYDIGQTATLNSPGAEKGFLTNGGFVFGGYARGVTISSPMTLNVTSTGTDGGASVFYFRGTYGTITSYRHYGSVPLTNVRLCNTTGLASITFDNPMSYKSSSIVPVSNTEEAVVLIRERVQLMSYRGQEEPRQVLVY